MCFWGCFLYKKFGKNEIGGLAMDVSGGTIPLSQPHGLCNNFYQFCHSFQANASCCTPEVG